LAEIAEKLETHVAREKANAQGRVVRDRQTLVDGFVYPKIALS
jgi:hypothetical protein